MPDALFATPTGAELEDFVDAAVRAPSLLNSQPWRFVVDRGMVQIHADRSRQLMALDPDGRELTMSCGAALYYMRVAARHAGWRATVDPFPLAEAPDLLASVSFERAHRPDTDDRHFRALALRRTNRRDFRADTVPLAVTAEMAGAVDSEGASLRILTSSEDKDGLSALVEAAAREQGEDADVREDIRAWLRPEHDPRPDGVSDSAQGMWDRHASMRAAASTVASHKARLVREAPAMLVLSTAGDTPADWLAAGQALARALVVAADHGLAASYANEPVEVEAYRARVAALSGGVPQVVFRVGYPDEAPATPRRRASDITTHEGRLGT